MTIEYGPNGWVAQEHNIGDGDRHLWVWPTRDAIAHEPFSGDCVCKPVEEAVFLPDGTSLFAHTHTELREPDRMANSSVYVMTETFAKAALGILVAVPAVVGYLVGRRRGRRG